MSERYAGVVDTLVACGRVVREAIVRAEHARLAEVVGLGADGADTTHVDQVAEVAALTFLEQAAPSMNVLSEETGLIDRGAALTAIVDPVDSTTNAVAGPVFVPEVTPSRDVLRADHLYGFPYYAFSVGVLDGEELVAGCVMNLPTGEVITACRGDGVRLDGARVRARDVRELREARLALIRPETERAWDALKPIVFGARRVRLTGCSALDLALVACGTLEGLVNPNRVSPGGWGEKVVDYVGALALLHETGGVLTDLDGNPVPITLDLTRRTPILGAATPTLHAELLRLLQEGWR